MAARQNAYRFAWCVEIVGPATVRGATVDLPEAAAIAAFGEPQRGRITTVGPITTALPNLFYGVRRESGTTITLDNRDGAIDPTEDWRLAPFTLWHFDRELGVKREELTGIVTAAEFVNARVTFTLGTVNDGILHDLLPAATIDPATGSPFDDSASPGAPIPVVFGSNVLVRLPSLNVSNTNEAIVSSWDYAAGFGSELRVEALYGDIDTQRPGLEVYGSWTGVPGSPTYSNPSLFTVTGDQSNRFAVGLPIRFKTTTGGGAFRYSAVKAYHAAPPRVEIIHPLLDAGLNTVQVIGDYLAVHDAYNAVTDGLLPVPAEPQAITAVRMFSQEDNPVLALVSNPDYRSGSGGHSPIDIIEDVLTNPAWGLSTHVQQEVNPFFSTYARIACAFAGLDGAIQGAIGYDGQQRRAEDVLDALLLIARGRLGTDAEGRWTLTVDSNQTSAATFCFGPGEQTGPRIKRITRYARAPLSTAIRNVVLHWSPLGRASARGGVRQSEYARFSTKAGGGRGRDRHYYNPFIRSQDVAAIVLQYLAEKLKGADETLEFVAGQEARDRVPGEVITVIDSVDGASGEWQINGVTRTLGETTLTCIRHASDAYGAPSGIVHSAEPTEAPNSRTAPGPGPNLLPNPEPAPPLKLSDESSGFSPPYEPYVNVPHGWTVGYIGGSVLSEFTVDASEEVRRGTVSGHYLRMVWDSVAPDSPRDFGGDGIITDPFPVRRGSDHIFSFYCDADEGLFVNTIEDDAPEFTSRQITPLIRDDTDTNNNGWARFYGRWRPMNATKRVRLGVYCSQAGAYQLEGFQFEPVATSARRPTDWRRTTATPSVLTRTVTITFDGASTYTAPLIKAGDRVLGCAAVVTDEILYGLANSLSIGTAISPTAWANRWTGYQVGERTDFANFVGGSVDVTYPADTDVQVTGYLGTGEVPLSIDSGSITLVLQYRRNEPVPAA